MDLSNDDFFQLFPYLGLAERRNLRRIGNRRLATIEILCKYHYNELQIVSFNTCTLHCNKQNVMCKFGILFVLFLMPFENLVSNLKKSFIVQCVNALVCDGVEIKMNEEEMKEELEILKHKTTFNRVICEVGVAPE